MVSLRLKGTALIIENGVMQMGLPPQSFDTSPRELEAQAVIDYHIVRSNSIEPIVPTLCDIATLNPALCGRFVSVETLHHEPLTEEGEESILAGYHRFVDKQGGVIYTNVSSYADFAEMEIPATELSIQGILYHEAIGKNSEKHFVIKPRFADDFTPNNNID
jgi:hypothetical protein